MVEVKNIFSFFGSRGCTKGGASTSEAKKASAAANGAKGGRPHKPNLFIKFCKEVWVKPDPELLNQLYIAIRKHRFWYELSPELNFRWFAKATLRFPEYFHVRNL